MARRYVAASGAPFSDEDAEIIGETLAQIASDNQVGEIRSLDKHLVFEAIERDPNSPLRRFYNWDKSAAARLHWLERTSLIMRSVRVVTITLGKRSKPVPMFLYDPEHPKRGAGSNERTRRGHVLTEDVLAHDPVYASALSMQIRSITASVDRLEHVTSLRPSPRSVVVLRNGLRSALNDYFGALAEAAAE